MTQALRRMGVAAVLSAGSVVSSFASGDQVKTVAPFRAELAVHWGDPAGSDAFLDDLKRSMAATLATACFAAVVLADGDEKPAESELVLTLVVAQTVDETRFDDPIAATLEPGEPSKELRRVAEFDVAMEASLSVRATGAPVYRKRFVASAVRRPMYVGEDPQATARAQTIVNAVRELTKTLGCGGEKLERKIRAALARSGPETPPAR